MNLSCSCYDDGESQQCRIYIAGDGGLDHMIERLRAAPAQDAQPAGWTSADADASRLALELECMLTDKDVPTPTVSRWWDSAHEALELHRQRLRDVAAAPASPAVEPLSLADMRGIVASHLDGDLCGADVTLMRATENFLAERWGLKLKGEK